MTKSLLIIDPCCPKPYDTETLYNTSQGGTESTVTRIAEGLSLWGWGVAVEQHNRKADFGRYWVPNMNQENGFEPENVVCLRRPQALYSARKRFPEAKLLLWCHDLFDPTAGREVSKACAETKAEIICVSHYHKSQILSQMGPYVVPKIWVSHPPIDPIVETLKSSSYEPFKLVWFSSPHKGLAGALEIFAELHKRDPRFELHVHNPGYFEDTKAVQPGVIIKPRGSYLDSLRTVSNSLAVFYPNTEAPETFGIVFTEANALGVPVLTHRFGSATEVLDHPSETVDCHNKERVIVTIQAWAAGQRPLVKARSDFSMRKSLQSFEKALSVVPP